MKQTKKATKKVTRKLYQMRYALGTLFCGMMISIMNNPIIVAAKETTDKKEGEEWDFLKEKGNGAFDGVDTVVKETGASAYASLRNISFVGLAIAIVVGALTLMFTNSAQRKDEAKGRIIWIVFSGCIALGAFSIVGIIAGIANSI